MESNNSIIVSSICWDEDGDIFLELRQVSNILKENIRLSNYGLGLKAIVFVPMGVKPNDDFHQEFIGYDSDENRFHIKKLLDYDTLKTADVDQFLRMAATAFFEEIDQIQLPDFDTVQFKQDVEALFLERGWLEGEAALK